MTRSNDPRVHELLAERALHGLSDGDARALDRLGATDDDSYDLAAAAIDLATLPVEPMPAGLAERLAAAAGVAPVTMATPAGTTPVASSSASISQHPRTIVGWQMPATSDRAPITPAPRRRHPAVTWFATAASLLVIAGVAWWLLRTAPASPTVAQARAQLLAAPDVATLAWKPTPEAPSASGDVIWSPAAQRGYMRFVGLPANDPTRTQYQLWIFDRARDQAYPVDGGVFDVASTGELIVPITAKLHVDDATLFAVTIERPGGVVVSRRERIVVTAARS